MLLRLASFQHVMMPLGKPQSKKKCAQALGLPDPVMQRTRNAHQTSSTNAIYRLNDATNPLRP